MTDAQLFRFFSHIDNGLELFVSLCTGTYVDHCWLWSGRRTEDDYGNCAYGKSTTGSHRVAYMHFIGPIPRGLQLDHFMCDNPPCCNPWHVRPATIRENVLRSNGPAAINARKTHCPLGHPYSPENTTISSGRRHCRICRRAEQARQEKRRDGRTEASAHMLERFPACKRGHPYTAENTAWVKGCRVCRTCRAASKQRYLAKLRAQKEQLK